MASKRDVTTLAKRLGVTVSDESCGGVWDITLDAPRGYRLRSSGCHLAVTTQHAMPREKPLFWDAVLSDLLPGLERCDDPTDNDCQAQGCFDCAT